MNEGYLGNPLLKKSGVSIEWTPELLKEYMKCAEDPIYFAEKYIQIVHVDRGLIPIKLYDYQKEIINAITFNRRVVANTSRQAGKCVSINTIVKVKIENIILNITMGELHEIFLEEANSWIETETSRWDRLCRMFDLWVSLPRFRQSFKGSWAKEGNLFWPYTHGTSVPKQKSSCERSYAKTELQESVVWTWRAILASKQEKSENHGEFNTGNQDKNERKSRDKYENRILFGQGNEQRRSTAGSIGETRYIQPGKTDKETWCRKGIETLGCTTDKMANDSKLKIRRRKERTESEKIFENKLQSFAWGEFGDRRSCYTLFDTMAGFGQIENRNYISEDRGSTQTKEKKILCNSDMGKFDCWESIRNRTKNSLEQPEYNSARWKLRDIPFRNKERRYHSAGGNAFGGRLAYLKRKQKDYVKKKELDQRTKRKFIEVFDVFGISVWTPSGWENVSKFNVTIPYTKYRVKFETGEFLDCADNHIFIEENGNQIYAKDSINKMIRSENGPTKVIEVTNSGIKEIMYDLSVDSEDHVYYTNGILSHNTTTAVAIILHYVLFNEYKTVALLANKGDAAREILDRVQIAYEALPSWLQQGVVTWNKGSLELENGCKVLAAASSSSAIRGKSVSFLYIDETAFLENWDEFFASVYPTISSGTQTKILLTSTPNSLNHFWKICKEAQENVDEDGKGKNGYIYIEVRWDRVPGRNEAWKEDTLASIGWNYEQFAQEFDCSFIGSTNTLISGSKLKQLSFSTPLIEKENIRQYKQPIQDHVYFLVADVSRGKGLDYSAFSVIDATKMPYEQVCTFRDNFIGPVDYASIIYRIAKLYNNANVLIEINDIGDQVSDTIYIEYGYEEMIFTESAGRSGMRISGGFGKNVNRGIRTTKSVKSIGCSMLKMLVEQNQILLHDFDTIQELSRFSRKGHSYEAESGSHDDTVMPLVLFSWLTDQTFFRDLTDINTLTQLREKTESQIEEDLLPFGFVDDGRSNIDEIVYTPNFLNF